jgi:hypothetical protein
MNMEKVERGIRNSVYLFYLSFGVVATICGLDVYSLQVPFLQAVYAEDAIIYHGILSLFAGMMLSIIAYMVPFNGFISYHIPTQFRLTISAFLLYVLHSTAINFIVADMSGLSITRTLGITPYILSIYCDISYIVINIYYCMFIIFPIISVLILGDRDNGRDADKIIKP